MPPYLPFLLALGEYIDAAPLDRLREQLGSRAATLATILPEIGARLEELPPPHAIGPEQERFRLYEAVGRLRTAVLVAVDSSRLTTAAQRLNFCAAVPLW